MHQQGQRKALKSGEHRGLAGLICMAKIQFLWRSDKTWGAIWPPSSPPLIRNEYGQICICLHNYYESESNLQNSGMYKFVIGAFHLQIFGAIGMYAKVAIKSAHTHYIFICAYKASQNNFLLQYKKVQLECTQSQQIVQQNLIVRSSNFIIIIIIITSSGDLQPSTAIANQLPGQLVYTQITTRGPNCFKFIMALIMPNRNIV